MYTGLVKNVTISLDDRLLEKSREYAQAKGASFNQLVRDLLSSTVLDSSERMQEAFDLSDRLGWRLNGPMPSREERNAR